MLETDFLRPDAMPIRLEQTLFLLMARSCVPLQEHVRMLPSLILKNQQSFQSLRCPQRSLQCAIGGYRHLWGNCPAQSC